MRPVDFAVFGLFLGIVLIHAFAALAVAASNGITAMLYASADKFGWSWFSDRSAYAETLANVDSALLLVALGVVLWRVVPQMLNWKGLPSRGTPPDEFSIPAPLPVRVFTTFGWVILVFMAIYALYYFPQSMVDGSREAVLFFLKTAGTEFSGSTIERLQSMERTGYLWIIICVSSFCGWAVDQCRRNARPSPERENAGPTGR